MERKFRDSRGLLCLISCESGKEFTKRIVEELERIYAKEPDLEHFQVTPSEEVFFPNREVKTVIKENIRGQDVYVVQCIDDPLAPDRSVNDNLMAVLTAINAAYNSDAESVTAVLPQFPYSRQDRKKTRESITAQQVCRFIEDSGANRVITIDIHSEAIEGFFRRAHLENLHAYRSICDYFVRNFPTDNLVVVAPDVGSADRARAYARRLNTELAIVDKERIDEEPSKIRSMSLVGEVKGKHVLLPDDMVGTGGTLINASKVVKARGAESVYLACTLPFFSGNAVESFDKHHAEGLFDVLIGTDAVFWGEKFQQEHPWYREVSVAPLFAHVIHNINQKRSVSKLLL